MSIMKHNEDTMGLAYDYVLVMSKKKRYNAQTAANYNYLNRIGKKKAIQIIQSKKNIFYDTHEPWIVKDFVYKNDYFTPRNMYLINPLYYLYYTYLVFEISSLFLNRRGILDFSRENMSVFYSGTLNFNTRKSEINKYALFNHSYSRFQQKRKEYFGKPVLKIDIQNFFQNIKINRLILKLRELYGNRSIINELELFFRRCKFDTLPQLHYSIASSILSQFYLQEFDDRIDELLTDEQLFLIRFVDDMYLVHLNGTGAIKKNNNILNQLSYFLWEDELALNTSKTKMLSVEEYRNDYETSKSEYNDVGSFSPEKIIDEKTTRILEDGSFISFIKELCELEKEKGIDLSEYKRLMVEYLSVEGEDANKVLNNLIFSNKWKNMSDRDLKKIIYSWKYILFNPSVFTVLYIFVYEFLEKKGAIKDNGKKIKRILNYLFRNKLFTFRDTLIAVSYLFQRNFEHRDLLKKIEGVNPVYVQFVDKYI